MALMNWNRTICLEERLRAEIDRGMYGDRPIISRDTPIDGGVYLGANQREAIVVDSSKSRLLQKCYESVLERVVDPADNLVDKTHVLPATFHFVREVLQPREQEVATLINYFAACADEKMSLGIFIQYRIGVCRHQALLAGFILEKFIKDGHLNGKVSIDRNACGFGAHAWVRYTSHRGDVYILDPMRNFLGTLEKSVRSGTWDYRRKRETF